MKKLFEESQLFENKDLKRIIREAYDEGWSDGHSTGVHEGPSLVGQRTKTSWSGDDWPSSEAKKDSDKL